MSKADEKAKLLKEEFNKCSAIMEKLLKEEPFPIKGYVLAANRSLDILNALYEQGHVPKEDFNNFTLSEIPIYLTD